MRHTPDHASASPSTQQYDNLATVSNSRLSLFIFFGQTPFRRPASKRDWPRRLLSPYIAPVIPRRPGVVSHKPLVDEASTGRYGRSRARVKPPRSPLVLGRVAHAMGVHRSGETATAARVNARGGRGERVGVMNYYGGT